MESMNRFPLLQTERLYLRQMALEDAADLYHFYSDSQLVEYLDWYGPSSIDESRELIASWNRGFDSNQLFPWGIALKSDNRLIGTIILIPLRGTFETNPLFPIVVGFELSRLHWHKGLMTEALGAVLEYGAHTIRAHRIQALVVPENTVSLKLLEKFGFEREGLLKKYSKHEATNHYMDVIMLAWIAP